MPRSATWGLLALLPLAACNTGPIGSGASMPAAGRGVGAQDQGFATAAANSDMFEIQSSQLAVQKARRPAVRVFAQRMIDAHTATTQQLTALAAQKGLSLPTAPDPAQQRTLSDLQGNRSSFDAAYVAAQTAGHRATVGAFQTEIGSGTDPDLKAFAQATLPDIQNHLTMAERLRGGGR